MIPKHPNTQKEQAESPATYRVLAIKKKKRSPSFGSNYSYLNSVYRKLSS